MEKFHQDVLRTCQIELLDDLDILPVLDSLLAKNILTRDDTHRVKNKATPRDQRRELLDIIPSKGPLAYDSFKQALQPDHLLTVLCRTEEDLQTKARKAAFVYLKPHLQRKYKAEERGVTQLQEVKKDVGDLVPKEVEITQEFLQRLISQVFPQSQFDEANLLFRNLVLTEPEEGATVSLPREMDKWTEIDLCQWIHSSVGITYPNVAQTIVEEKITGLVFHYSTEDDLKKVFGLQLKYGEKKSMLIKRDHFLESSQMESGGDVSLPRICDGLGKNKEAEKMPVGRFFNQNLRLRRKLICLLCQGEGKFVGDIHPILVVNRPAEYMDKAYIARNLSFLGDISWTAVFDFYHTAAVYDFLCKDRGCAVDIISTPDKFVAQRGESQKAVEELQKHLQTSTHTPWIFCNGFKGKDQTAMDAHKWKLQRREGFQACVRFFNNEIPTGRAIVVFCLLSDDWKVMLEGAEELCFTFQDQWMCVVEDDDLAKDWMTGLMSRHVCLDRYLLDLRVVAGLPWHQVQETVQEIQDLKETGVFSLPMADGSYCRVTEAQKRDLGFEDLDVLGAYECEGVYSTQERSELKSDVEQKFYKGGEVSWLNFWFKTHVCFRDKAKILLKMVRNVLGKMPQTDEICEGFVQRLHLYHQPGAGGTTVGKSVLWDLRDEYRCAILRTLSSPEKVAEQLYKLWSFRERSSPKPVLILVDNQHDEQVDMVQAALEDQVKKGMKESGRMLPDIMCLLLLCRRRSRLLGAEVPLAIDSVLLKQELSMSELEWFREKAKQLESRKHGVDPKLLMSFNILKENFDAAFIRRSVSTLLADFETPMEKNLVKLIAFLNHYDHRGRSLPVETFDVFMRRQITGSREPSDANQAISQRARARRWETRLGSAVLVLLNETSGSALGKKRGISITTSLLANEVFRQIRTENNETVSEIALQVLHSEDFFPGKRVGKEQHDLLDITVSILKTRPVGMFGKREEFSPLIEDIRRQESFGNAQGVLEDGFELTKDPFIAQQAARLAIVSKDFDSALRFIERAIEILPNDPYLLDTYGRLYKERLTAVYRSRREDESLSVAEVKKVVTLARRGIEVFQQEQLAPLKGSRNPEPGYLGEIDTTLLLLDCLRCWKGFKDKSNFNKFMTQTNFLPEEAKAVFGAKIYFIKNLENGLLSTMRQLDDVLVHLRAAANSDHDSLDSKLQCVRKNVSSYFGELGTFVAAEEPSPSEQCAYRRRRMLGLGGRTLGAMLDLCLRPGGVDIICSIKDLANQNVLTEHADASDCEASLFASLVLTLFEEKHMHDVNFQSLVKLSKKLLDLDETKGLATLESYLLYTLFNWPRSGQQSGEAGALRDLLRRWREAFLKKYPQCLVNGRPPRTMFYLGKGGGMNAVRTEVELRDGAGKVHKVAGGMQRDILKGVLCESGFSVEVMLEGAVPIKIPTLFSIPGARERCQKKGTAVNFSLGLSWAGPRAVDVQAEDPLPVDDKGLTPGPNCAPLATADAVQTASLEYTHDSSSEELTKLDAQLAEVRLLKMQEAQASELANEEVRGDGVIRSSKPGLASTPLNSGRPS